MSYVKTGKSKTGINVQWNVHYNRDTAIEDTNLCLNLHYISHLCVTDVF